MVLLLGLSLAAWLWRNCFDWRTNCLLLDCWGVVVIWDHSHDSLCIRMPQREPGGSKAQGSISEIKLKERSAECSGLSGLNRSNAPSHSKKLRKRQLNGFSSSKSFCLRIQMSRMDRIESDESSFAVPAVPTATVKAVSFDKARLQSLADNAMSLVHCASRLFLC